MKVLVCGGRKYTNQLRLFDVLDRLHRIRGPITTVIHGEAKGADRLAGDWAISRDIMIDSYPAQWGKHGRAAGPIRNRQMIEEGRPDLVVVFPGGRGTADMRKRALATKIKVEDVQ